ASTVALVHRTLGARRRRDGDRRLDHKILASKLEAGGYIYMYMRRSRVRYAWVGCLAVCLIGCGGGGGGNSTPQAPGPQAPSPPPSPSPPPPPPAAEVTFQIDSTRDVRPISKFIYGMNFGISDADTRPANLALSPSGGNPMTAYNWETNASTAGEDWFNQNDDYLGGGNVPGGAVTPMIEAALNADAGIIVTVPLIGYVAADKNGGGDVNQTQNYLNVRFHQSLARKPSGAFLTSPDLTDEFVYQDEWVHFLDVTYPDAIGHASAPIYFSLDNEPDLWHATHPRLRGAETGNAGANVTYAELI